MDVWAVTEMGTETDIRVRTSSPRDILRSHLNMSQYDDNFRPLDLKQVKTYPLAGRRGKVSLEDFAKPISENASVKDFLASLPNVLAVQSLNKLVQRMRRARELQKPIIWGVGGHVIKTGLAPVLIDLMKL